TAGLTLAAHLSEDPNVTVLVLEAGNANLDDPAILVPAQYLRLADERYDWKFVTTEQRYCNNRQYVWPRGKGLGGSSAANFMAYIRPSVGDVDAWEELGNPGWNWNHYLKYSKRSEKWVCVKKIGCHFLTHVRFTDPSPEQTIKYRQTSEERFHGRNGELEVCFPPLIMDGEAPYQMVLHSSVAFLEPNLVRNNLLVLPGANVSRLLFQEPDDLSASKDLSVLKVEEVEFSRGEATLTVRPTRDVILCAGTLKSPQVLDLSGIGNPSVLAPLGVDCKIALDGVGENVQEHIYFLWWAYSMFARDLSLVSESQQGIHTLGLAGFTFTPMQQVCPNADELITSHCAKLKSLYQDGKISLALWEQYQIQMRVLQSETSVDMEWTTIPQCHTFRTQPEDGKQYMTVLVALNRPFSRGSIHIASRDPVEQPLMDPHYFEHDFDMQLLVEGLKFARKVAEEEPFRSCIVREVDPGPAVQTDKEMREYIIDGLMTAFHTVGSCSMLPREKGGVVDSRLKVYGTENVRVVDLSIVPLHIAAHTQ
ncbi:alcohol oxidase, partial [Dacryopinax primogenitus]